MARLYGSIYAMLCASSQMLRHMNISAGCMQTYLQSDAVKGALNETRSALAALTLLKKVCDQPALLTDKSAKQALGDSTERAEQGDDCAGRETGGGFDRVDDNDTDDDRCCGSVTTDSFIASDSEVEADLSDDEASNSDDSDEDEDYCPGGRSSGQQRRVVPNRTQQRAAQPDEHVCALPGVEVAGLSAEEVLDRLQRRQDKDSCKTVRAHGGQALRIELEIVRCAHLRQHPKLPHAQAASEQVADILFCIFAWRIESKLTFRGQDAQVFTMALRKRLTSEGHRTLVFSQSRVMLDSLQEACARDELRSVRVDGSIGSAAKRQAVVERFQQDTSIPVFLLSSQVRMQYLFPKTLAYIQHALGAKP